MRPTNFACYIVATGVAWLAFNLCSTNAAEATILNRPVAIAASADGKQAYIGNYNASVITVLDVESLKTHSVDGDWQGLVDLATIPGTNKIVVAANHPPSLTIVTCDTNDHRSFESIKLSGIPARVAVSTDGGFACISMTWEHAVSIVKLPTMEQPELTEIRVISLDFQPKELLTLPTGLFLVADAFGGKIALVDTEKTIRKSKIVGHHIGGLARDDSRGTIAIAHQKLSRIAQASRDDIHWGSLIQNVVTVLPESPILDARIDLQKVTIVHQIGDVGNGAGDPAGIVAWDGNLAVAITGTNQIFFRRPVSDRNQFLNVGRMSTRIVRLDSTQFLSINTLEDTATLIDSSDHGLKSIGTKRFPQTQFERGEAAFYSAKLSHDGWMSCSSCHVDGHSPGLLADTLSDGQYGNPKRIPSLMHSATTKPWGWDGSKETLEEQILHSIETTMNRDQRSREAGPDDETIASDIAAYLRTLSLAPVMVPESKAISKGKSIFSDRGCIKCHDSKSEYTSSETYDLGITDEMGHKKFNPPSLLGLRHRRAYFHDARFQTLDKLLLAHPDAKMNWTNKELSNIKAFLNSL